MNSGGDIGKILILATESCAYPGADSVGQAHSSYPTNTYILRVRAPVLFPEQFYIDCFKKRISGIIVMSCGEECPYDGAGHDDDPADSCPAARSVPMTARTRPSPQDWTGYIR